jgi:DNA-binding MarR family transcriptional regulator
MSTSTASSAAAREAWSLFWRIFSADKPRRMSALAQALMCDNSNVTGIVDRLEALGLVERRPAEHDRRVKTVALTERGKTVRGVVQLRMSEPPPPLARLSEEDAVALRGILQRALDV